MLILTLILILIHSIPFHSIPMHAQPDVLCLQEVDDKVFSEYLAPHLRRHGFEVCACLFSRGWGKI